MERGGGGRGGVSKSPECQEAWPSVLHHRQVGVSRRAWRREGLQELEEVSWGVALHLAQLPRPPTPATFSRTLPETTHCGKPQWVCARARMRVFR